MSKKKIELNHEGVGALLHSAELAAALEGIASSAATRCGDGYSFDVKSMPTRVIASVFTENEDAAQDNLENNTILRNLR